MGGCTGTGLICYDPKQSAIRRAREEVRVVSGIDISAFCESEGLEESSHRITSVSLTVKGRDRFYGGEPSGRFLLGLPTTAVALFGYESEIIPAKLFGFIPEGKRESATVLYRQGPTTGC